LEFEVEITTEDRIKGVLLGQACGDALGSHYEFGPPSHGQAAMKQGTFGHAPGEWTDDTSQAVAVALGRSQPEAVAAQLLRWFGSHPRDVGNQTRAVMSRARTPQDLKAFAVRGAAEPRPQGWDPGTGNGSLMRTGPVCLPFLGDQVAVARAAQEISDLTHADEYSGDSCILWSLAIESAIVTPAGFTASQVTEGWGTSHRTAADSGKPQSRKR
jgi:ADP-ribosyl-[dinitrogen reductase] hydrolase